MKYKAANIHGDFFAIGRVTNHIATWRNTPVTESAYVSAQLNMRKAIVLLPSEFAITVDIVTPSNCVNENKTSKLGQPTSTNSQHIIAPMKMPIIVIASPLKPANVKFIVGNNEVKNIHMHPSQNANIFLPDI
jgi:hypothetical protein